jgi:uncharacterized peroxidase-related enzyme
VGAHARNLQLQGQKAQDVDAIASGEAEKSQVTEKERGLLDYVKTLTLQPGKVSDKQVEGLRKAGYTDEEIFEASFITAMFAFFNRMADAYGLDYPMNGWMPESLRQQRGAAPLGGPKRPNEAPNVKSLTPPAK